MQVILFNSRNLNGSHFNLDLRICCPKCPELASFEYEI